MVDTNQDEILEFDFARSSTNSPVGTHVIFQGMRLTLLGAKNEKGWKGFDKENVQR